MEMIQPIRLRLHLDSRSMPTQLVMSLVYEFFFVGIGVWQCGGVVCVSVSVDLWMWGRRRGCSIVLTSHLFYFEPIFK
jgi:hypothetical protein